jgi:hypothetical protein
MSITQQPARVSKNYTIHSKHPKPMSKAKQPIAKKHQDCEFLIEDNGNDLISQNNAQITLTNVKLNNDFFSKKKPKEFEKDMKKYGLDEKIMHIEILKTNIQKQFGPVEQPRENKILFPFQKRNRSSSPPKESPLNKFNVPRANSPTPCKVVPMVAQNFAIFASKNEEFLNALEIPKEEKYTADSNSLEEGGKKAEDESWMYKTYSKHSQDEDIVHEKPIDTLMDFLKGDD